ncbi:MAG: hypothetical protein L0Z50_09220 [Verrucomicrobiales bacterium]|nr:hypothetical protein [Verrucomicrobiales bacterium]
MHHHLQTLSRLLICSLLIVCSRAQAEDQKADPTGTWTWTATTQGGETRQASMKLKLEGEKLTGTVTGRNTDAAISEAKLAGDEISFNVVRERNGNKFTQKYIGKISGDTVKGKIEFERNGETVRREWEAKREGGKPKPAASLAGKWRYSFTTSGGQTLEPVLDLKQDGDKITGTVKVNERESAISEGKIANGEVSFKVVRERDGNSFTSKYNGTLEGDVFKGKINSNFGGNERTYDFEAKRVKE